jgi:hypothetical protein
VSRSPIRGLTAAALITLAVAGTAAGSTTGESEDLVLTSVHRGDHDYSDYTFGVAASPVAGLYPGEHGQVRLSFTNPYPYAIRIYRTQAELVSTSRRGCRPVRANLEVRAFQGHLPFTVPAKARINAGSFEVRMPNSVSDACQATTFTLWISGKAAKAGR